MAITLVSTVTIGSGGASSIEWTGIGQTGKDLLILLSGRAAVSALRNDVGVSFNGVTTNRTYRSLYHNGFNVFGSNGSQISTFAGAVGSTATSNTFSNVSITVGNYATNTAKPVNLDAVIENAQQEAWGEILTGLWNVTDAVTSITLTPTSSTFVQNSVASLYIIS
jgi:hypothetical protein